MTKTITVFLSIALLGCFILCGEENTPDINRAAKDNTEFALKIFQELSKGNENVFISPYSISSALAMTYAGARGNTAQQMEEALIFSLGQEMLHKAIREINSSLERFRDSKAIQLNIANSIWPQKGYAFLDTFRDLLKEYYNVEIYLTDYSKPDAAKENINNWVAEKTSNKILNMIPPGALSPLTVLVLVNAIYFRASWETEFDADLTHEADFSVSEKLSIKVQMMNIKSKFGYASYDGYSLLSMPYHERELYMVIILPDSTDGINSLIGSLTADDLLKISALMQIVEVDVYIPSFKMTYEKTLNETFHALGMTEAFMPDSADLTGMYDRAKSGGENLFISNIRHKAFIEVSEEGTEAAAATSVEISRTSHDPGRQTFIFRADRPFLFFIKDSRTNSILFMGKLVNPAK